MPNEPKFPIKRHPTRDPVPPGVPPGGLPSGLIEDGDLYAAAAPDVPGTGSEHKDAGLLVGELEGWVLRFKRNLAAFTTLSGAYQTATGQLPTGARRRGMPVLEFAASLDTGPEATERQTCILDLKELPPDHVQHVLVPLMHLASSRLVEAAIAIEKYGTRLAGCFSDSKPSQSGG